MKSRNFAGSRVVHGWTPDRWETSVAVCRIWFTLFQNAFNKDNARPWMRASAKAPLFGGSSPPASKAALPCPRDCSFDFSSMERRPKFLGGTDGKWIISPINPPACVIPESSVSGKYRLQPHVATQHTLFAMGVGSGRVRERQHDSERCRSAGKQGQFCEAWHAGPARSHSRSRLCGRPGRLHWGWTSGHDFRQVARPCI